MLLHVHEWGAKGAPPVVCLHGISAHGRRYRRLAEERLEADYRVLALDLRGHARSGYDPPWNLSTHVADVVETVEAAGVERATWIGHSFGGRLVLELAAREPELIERAVLLDPAIQILPHVGYDFAEAERGDESFAAAEEAILERWATGSVTPREFLEEDLSEHLMPSPDGRLRFQYCRSTVVTGYGELCADPPPAETLRVPTLLVYSPAFGLVRDEQLQAYSSALGELLEVRTVPGGHDVYWDSYDEVADAVERFLGATR